MSKIRLVHQPRNFVDREHDDGSLDRQMSVVFQLTDPDWSFEFEGVGVLPAFVQPGDRQLDLVKLWCPPCKTQVGLIWCVEVAPRLPEHRPYLIADTHHPTGKTRPDGRPRYRRMSALIDDAGDRGARLLALSEGGTAPDELGAYCAHGRLTFDVTQARARGQKALAAIIAAEQRGDAPKIGSWKLNLRR